MPIETDPMIKGYLHHAYTLGMLQLKGDEMLPWVYNNYVQTFFRLKGFGEFNFSVSWTKFTEVFDWQRITGELLGDCGVSPVDFIRNSILNGYYAYCLMDEYSIPHRQAYRLLKNHYHDTLIYGYDAPSDSFDIIGFTEERVYRPTKISAKLVLKSRPVELNLLKLRENVKFEIRPEYIRETLLEYLHPETIHERYNMWFVAPRDNLFGLEACRHLSVALRSTGERAEEENYIYCHVLWEHKNCMLARIKYLLENGYMTDASLYERYSEVEKLALRMRNLYLKYFIAKDRVIIDRLVKDNDAAARLEAEILPLVADDIRLG